MLHGVNTLCARTVCCCYALVLACASTALPAAVAIDFVSVGNARNPADPSTGKGAVNYEYRIGKTEITINQYTAFLNAAAKGLNFGLWNGERSGIARSGDVGTYQYTALGDRERPVNYIDSAFDAARFANWMHNGQPDVPPNSGAATEGGAYTLYGAVSGFPVRNANAKFWIPSDNEWYKAAYYQPAAAGGDADGYWLYPMRSNGVPFSDQPPGVTPDNTRVGNFFRDDGLPNGYDDGYAVTGSTALPAAPALTAAGAYGAAASHYGTFDQGGNVMEWVEARFGTNAFRGGGWRSDELAMRASTLTTLSYDHLDQLGFRLGATIPEREWQVSSASARLH